MHITKPLQNLAVVLLLLVGCSSGESKGSAEEGAGGIQASSFYNGRKLSTGYCLKSNNGVVYWAQNPDDDDAGGDGCDTYGWTGLPTGGRFPAGYSGPSGTLDEAGYAWGPRQESPSDDKLTGYRSMWWTAEEQTNGLGAPYSHIVDDGWTLTVNNTSETKANKSYGLSVRCVQDE